MTESISMVTDAAEPSQARPPQEEQRVRRPCPVCGFGSRRLDRFCRQCGVKLEQGLEQGQAAATGSLYATATVTPESVERTQGQTGVGG